jgi:hypothetical protein
LFNYVTFVYLSKPGDDEEWTRADCVAGIDLAKLAVVDAVLREGEETRHVTCV